MPDVEPGVSRKAKSLRNLLSGIAFTPVPRKTEQTVGTVLAAVRLANSFFLLSAFLKTCLYYV